MCHVPREWWWPARSASVSPTRQYNLTQHNPNTFHCRDWLAFIWYNVTLHLMKSPHYMHKHSLQLKFHSISFIIASPKYIWIHTWYSQRSQVSDHHELSVKSLQLTNFPSDPCSSLACPPPLTCTTHGTTEPSCRCLSRCLSLQQPDSNLSVFHGSFLIHAASKDFQVSHHVVQAVCQFYFCSKSEYIFCILRSNTDQHMFFVTKP